MYHSLGLLQIDLHTSVETALTCPYGPYSKIMYTQMWLKDWLYIKLGYVGITYIQVGDYETVVNFFISAIKWHDQNLPTLFSLWTDKTIHVNLCKKSISKKNNLYKNSNTTSSSVLPQCVSCTTKLLSSLDVCMYYIYYIYMHSARMYNTYIEIRKYKWAWLITFRSISTISTTNF